MASLAAAAALFVAMVVMAAVSAREGERRARRVAVALAVALPLPYLLAAFVSPSFVAAAVVIATIAAAVFLALPTEAPRPLCDETPASRIDERDIMFARRLLEPGSGRFRTYYGMRPENIPLDEKFREQPGLLATGSTAWDPVTFAAARASFETVHQLHPVVDGEPATERVDCDPAGITGFISTWALRSGAVSTGVTGLRDYHLYTHVGRGPDWGEPVDLPHEWAFALTVEMRKEMIDSAPLGPTVMESAQQYLSSGVIAIQIADFIRRLGWRARAHIDANYRVVCPLVARDAGLGEIGRMGLLMTPELGPRVRIAVVTTDLPLVPTPRGERPDHRGLLPDLQKVRGSVPVAVDIVRRPRVRRRRAPVADRPGVVLHVLVHRRHRLRAVRPRLSLLASRQRPP